MAVRVIKTENGKLCNSCGAAAHRTIQACYSIDLCTECTQVLAQKVQKTDDNFACKHCGNKIEEIHQFCPFCGDRILRTCETCYWKTQRNDETYDYIEPEQGYYCVCGIGVCFP